MTALVLRLALSVSDPVGLQMCATSPSKPVRRALAASPRVPAGLLEQLAADRDPHVAQVALRRSVDADLLAAHVGGVGGRAFAAARNPSTPSDALERAVRAAHREDIVLAALCNPSLDESVRRQVLDPQRASALVAVSGSSAERAVRAHELVINNRWMADTPGRWSSTVRRGILGLPGLPADVVNEAVKGKRSIRPHPSLVDGVTWSLDALLRHGHPASDLAALEHADVDPVAAAQLLFARGAARVDAHIVGRVVDKAGTVALDALAASALSATCMIAARWVSPLVGYVPPRRDRRVSFGAIAAALGGFGGDEAAWATLLALADEWSGSFDDLVAVAAAL